MDTFKWLSLFCFLLMGYTCQSQYQYKRDNGMNLLVERFLHFSPDSIIHSSIRNMSFRDVISILKKEKPFLSSKDTYLKDLYIKNLSVGEDYSNQKGFLNAFYKSSAHFFEVDEKDFKLVLNPILNLQFGREYSGNRNIFLNQRGLELWGELDDAFYFYSSFFENQASFFNYINPFIEQYKSIPGQGNYKFFNSSLFNTPDAFDFSNAVAYLGFKISKNAQLELGHGHNFFGNGLRSLLLSDFANNYFYFKINLRVWKLHYQTIIAELSSGTARFRPDNILLPKKYMATHYLSFKVNPKLELALFESVVFSRENQFELQYLNPVILYRTVEHFLDSPDNVLIGFNANWQLNNFTSLYGQFVLDDLKTSELFNNSGWWANKYGLQLGFKYLNILGISNLDGQLEYNVVRPFTYSHHVQSEAFPEISVSNYSHYNQALAHPLGANFREVMFVLRYLLNHKLQLQGSYIYTNVGRNNIENYGSDILIPNGSRVSNFDNTVLQGSLSKISIFDFKASYSLFHNFYLDLFFKYRTDKNPDFQNTKTHFIGSGIRYNIGNTQIDY